MTLPGTFPSLVTPIQGSIPALHPRKQCLSQGWGSP